MFHVEQIGQQKLPVSWWGSPAYSSGDVIAGGTMPNDTPPAQGDKPIVNDSVELLKNFKAEMDRKMSNLADTNARLIQQLESMKTPAKAPPKRETDDELADLLIDNPKEYARLIKQQAKEEVLAEVSSMGQRQAKEASTIRQLTQEFPELQFDDHPLTKKAVELYSQLPEDEKSSPLAYKIAVKDAAQELGIKPRSKRSDDEVDADAFQMGGGGATSTRTRGKAKSKDELDEVTLAFSKALGRNTDDPKVKERIAKYSQRKNWMRYE
jgi:hypothetical protein